MLCYGVFIYPFDVLVYLSPYDICGVLISPSWFVGVSIATNCVGCSSHPCIVLVYLSPMYCIWCTCHGFCVVWCIITIGLNASSYCVFYLSLFVITLIVNISNVWLFTFVFPYHITSYCYILVTSTRSDH